MSWGLSRRGWAILLLVVVAVAAAAVAQLGWLAWWARDVPTGAAEWIWAPLPRHRVASLAFWAVRDFRLDAVPERAELLALADEEYVAWLNGHRVGSDRYRPGAALDVYEVAPLLLPGANRLVFEVRSARGAGGLLAALRAGDATPVVTDPTWRVVRRAAPGLVEGRLPLGDAAAAVSWGRPPAGRWGLPERGPVRPLAGDVADLCDPLPAPAGSGAPPARTVFDWGREVYGYLRLDRAPRAAAAGPGAALLLTGDRPLQPLAEPHQAAPVVVAPAAATWTDTVPRRFRYATVTGLDGLVAAAVLPVDPAAAGRLPPAPAETGPAGLLGLRVPPQLTPLEKEVRRRLDGEEEPPGDAGGGRPPG